MVYNFRAAEEYAARGDDFELAGEFPGRSSFLYADGRVFHTYSVYARGLETIGGSYYLLDETALGRQEDWEEPAGPCRQRARRPARLQRLTLGSAGGQVCAPPRVVDNGPDERASATLRRGARGALDPGVSRVRKRVRFRGSAGRAPGG